MMPDYVYKTEPYEHQREVFELSRDAEAFAHLMEMGCVSCDTEYLSPTGWRRMDQYDNGLVAQYDPANQLATFVRPNDYVKLPCDKMIHFNSARGLDQLLSPEHRVLFADRNGRLKVTSAHSIWEEQQKNKTGTRKRFPSTFRLVGDEVVIGLGLSEEILRILVAVIADGSFPRHSPRTKRCVVRLKKQRKIKRLRSLLKKANIDCYERPQNGYTVFSFNSPWRIKYYDETFWKADYIERGIICDECWRWDGTERKSGGRAFFTRVKASADFIQYCFASLNKRASLLEQVREDGIDYIVHIAGTGRSGNLLSVGNDKDRIRYTKSPDGFKYCFNVPTSFLLFRRNGCIFPSGNTGKSKVNVDTAAYLFQQGKIESLLIVAPNGVHSNWLINEIPAHLPDSVDHATAVWSASPKKTDRLRVQDVLRAGPEVLKIVAMNVEAMWTKKAKEFAAKFLALGPCMLVVDESSKIKTPGSKRTRALTLLGKRATYRRILTGTPVTQGPFDLFAQFKFLSPTIMNYSSFTAFKHRYGEFERKRTTNNRLGYYDELVQYRNIEELQECIRPYSFTVRKADCLDLPPKVYEQRFIELSPEQRAIYKDLIDNLVAEHNGIKLTGTMALTQLLRLQQIVGGHVSDGDNTLPIGDKNPRLAALLDILDEVDGKVIIWARFRAEIGMIAAALKEKYGDGSVVEYHGGCAQDDRAYAITCFQDIPYDDPLSARFFIGNQASGGYGLTLTAATTMIYYSNDFSLEHRLQSEDRAHRIGQTKSVTYVDLVAPGTVDEKILAALKGKKDVAEMFSGGKTLEDWL